MRCGEFCVTGEGFDPAVHLCIQDANLLPMKLALHLKVSKTDPFRNGVYINIFSNASLCPVQAMCDYLIMRRQWHQDSKALFISSEGIPLTRTFFVNKLHCLLTKAGHSPTNFTGHSFRIGAATTAAASGVEDHLIQTLGRWSSQAYSRYIRTADLSIKSAQMAMCSKLSE